MRVKPNPNGRRLDNEDEEEQKRSYRVRITRKRAKKYKRASIVLFSYVRLNRKMSNLEIGPVGRCTTKRETKRTGGEDGRTAHNKTRKETGEHAGRKRATKWK